jgi:hypothetical protein
LAGCKAGYALAAMRTMALTWALLIAFGLVTFTIIGLSHG